jgi:hypothetical protein
MARLFTGGFEFGSLAAEAAVQALSNTTNLGTAGTNYTWETSGGRSGPGCIFYNGNPSENYGMQTASLSTSLTTLYFARMAVKLTAYPTGGSLAQWWPLGISDTSFNGAEVDVSYTGVVLLCQASNSSVVTTSTTTLALNQWYVLELGWNPATGASVVMVNGLACCTGTCAAGSVASIISYTSNFDGNAGSQGGGYIDDWAVNDNTGSNCNSWCGQGGVVFLKALSDNSNTGFKAGGSGGGTTSLYAALQPPPAGVVYGSATSTSQISDATSNTTDNYVANLQSYTTAGVPANATIVCAKAICSMGNSSTTSRTAGIQSKSNPVIAEVTGGSGTTAAATFPTGWSSLSTAYSYNPAVTLGSSPTVEFRKATASTDAIQADLLGMLVEYSQPVAYGAVVSAAVNRASTY